MSTQPGPVLEATPARQAVAGRGIVKILIVSTLLAVAAMGAVWALSSGRLDGARSAERAGAGPAAAAVSTPVTSAPSSK